MSLGGNEGFQEGITLGGRVLGRERVRESGGVSVRGKGVWESVGLVKVMESGSEAVSFGSREFGRQEV